MMEYFIQADFKVSHYYPLPSGMSLCELEDHKIVKNYYVIWDTLYITYDDFTSVEINSIKDPDYFNFFKRPLTVFPICKLDNDWFEEAECCCGKCVSI